MGHSASHCTAIAAAFLLLSAPAALAAEVEFIAIGDLPYNAEQETILEQRINPALRASTAPFMVHYGDFKGGSAPCSTAGIEAAKASMTAAFPGPVYFTPGDNDWTDCDRGSTGAPVSELGQLAELRRIFFGDLPVGGDSGGDGEVARQPLYPENARWRYPAGPAGAAEGGVLFLTLHIVGTNNGRRQILRDDVELALARVAARDQANRVWLDAAFDEARTRKAAAMVVVAQADITNPGGSGPCTAFNRTRCDAFLEIREQLRHVARRFGKPMLFIHGDTGPYCLDRDFGGAKAPTLWRLNATGDYRIVDATLITVDTDDAEAPFRARSLVAGTLPDDGCG